MPYSYKLNYLNYVCGKDFKYNNKMVKYCCKKNTYNVVIPHVVISYFRHWRAYTESKASFITYVNDAYVYVCIEDNHSIYAQSLYRVIQNILIQQS